MTVLTQNLRRTAHYIVSEANGFRSRGVGIVPSGSGKVEPGTVMGRISTGAATPGANGGNTGNATISAVTLGAGAKTGAYTVVFTAATKFDVHDPDGFKLKSGSTGAAYADDIGFTITAGGTPMVAGDGFTIAVVLGAVRRVPLDLEAEDGSQVADAILYEGCDATDADVRRTFTERDTEVQADVLIWPDVITETQKAAALSELARQGIVAR